MLQRTGVLFLAWWVLCSLLLSGMAVAQTEGELPGPGPTEGWPILRRLLSSQDLRTVEPTRFPQQAMCSDSGLAR